MDGPYTIAIGSALLMLSDTSSLGSVELVGIVCGLAACAYLVGSLPARNAREPKLDLHAMLRVKGLSACEPTLAAWGAKRAAASELCSARVEYVAVAASFGSELSERTLSAARVVEMGGLRAGTAGRKTIHRAATVSSRRASRRGRKNEPNRPERSRTNE